MTNDSLISLTKMTLAQQDTIEKLQKEKAGLIAKWFKKGQNSIKRKNKSGCCCIINDDDEIESLCGAHEAYVEELKNLMCEAQSKMRTVANERWKKALGGRL